LRPSCCSHRQRKARTRKQCCAAHSDVGLARSARKRTCNATQCEFAFPPTQPTDRVRWCRPSSNVRRLTRHVACCRTAPYSSATSVALQLASRHRSRVICHTRDGQWLDAACCVPCVSCRMLSYGHPCRPFPHARTHAHAQLASPDAFVGMALVDEVVGHNASVAPRVRSHRFSHSCCTHCAPIAAAALPACSSRSSRPPAPRRRCWRK
jgi:hypothetical protein